MKTKSLSGGFTPLFVAITQRNYEIFDILAGNNANIDTQDINGNTPLIYVIQDNNLSVANKLLELGANVNTANKKGLTPLIAAMLYMSELADTLIDKGANVNAQMNDGLSCLHIAVIKQNNSLLMKLINKSISLKFTATRLNALSNPFHHAVSQIFQQWKYFCLTEQPLKMQRNYWNKHTTKKYNSFYISHCF